MAFKSAGSWSRGAKLRNRKFRPCWFGASFPRIGKSCSSLRDLVGLHGRREIDAFSELLKHSPDDRTTESLCRLVLLNLLPALVERDRSTFGEALYEFNRKGGELFRLIQGGVYAHPRIEELVKTIRAFGIKGVGQSSWGPTIFALGSPDELPQLCNWLTLKHGIAKEEVIVTSGRNRGVLVGTG